MTITSTLTGSWTDVCGIDQLIPDRGVAAMVDGCQVAIFALGDGEVYAIDNRDPWSGANIMSRGIVGSIGGRVVVAAPMYKQHVDLETGEGVEQPHISVRTWPVRVENGRIQIGSVELDLDAEAAA